jgi:hypothetical protein
MRGAGRMDPNLLAALQQAQMQGPKPLIEFKSGRMDYNGRIVKPDRRKGLIRVMKDP